MFFKLHQFFKKGIFHPVLFLVLLVKPCAGQEAHEILTNLIKIPSLSGKEKEAGVYLEKICRKKGLHIRVFSKTDSSYNFSASIFPLTQKRPNIILLNHLDVVGIDDEKEWKKSPFCGTIENDTLWGRGTLDMKGMAVMQLMAMLKLKKSVDTSKIKYNVTLLCLSGEETGGKKGAKLICDNYLDELNPAVVLGEGGGGLQGIIPGKPEQKVFFVSVAEKKSLWIKLEARVNSHGHASVPTEKSANKLILKAVNKVENNDPKIKFDHTTRTTFKKLGHLVPGFKGFLLGHVNWIIFRPLRHRVLTSNELFLPMVQNTFQLTSIGNPPGAINQIPTVSDAYFDCRLLPRFNEEPFTIKRLMRILDPRIKLTVLDESPEAEPTKPDQFFDHLTSAIRQNYSGAEVIPFLFLASSDNSYFRSKKIPTYGVMPLELNANLMQSVHGCNERIPLSGLKSGIDTYYSFLVMAALK